MNEKINNVHFSSKNQTWETPQNLYDKLDKEFHFTLDPCCDLKTAKCKKFYTKKDNGLVKSWQNEIVFMNPPYGREISAWVEKAYNESKNGALVVALLPARTDTRYFHNWIYSGKAEIRFLKGRLKFSGFKNSAPFPSMIVIWKSKDVI